MMIAVLHKSSHKIVERKHVSIESSNVSATGNNLGKTKEVYIKQHDIFEPNHTEVNKITNSTNFTELIEDDTPDTVHENISSEVKFATNVSSVGVQSSSISSKNLKQTDDSEVSEEENIDVEKDLTIKGTTNINDNSKNSDLLIEPKDDKSCNFSQNALKKVENSHKSLKSSHTSTSENYSVKTQANLNVNEKQINITDHSNTEVDDKDYINANKSETQSTVKEKSNKVDIIKLFDRQQELCEILSEYLTVEITQLEKAKVHLKKASNKKCKNVHAKLNDLKKCCQQYDNL